MARIVPILSTTALLVACFAIVGCGSESLAGAPVAGDDRAITGRDTPIVLPLLVNDEATSPSTLDVGSLDLDPAAAGIQQHRTTEAGDYLLDCLGDVRFVPTPGFRGEATAPYTIADSLGEVSAPARIIITVEAD